MSVIAVPAVWRRWLKFNLVGALGMVIQLGSLWLLTRACHMNYLLATACAVELAVVHNFLWHERFTWRDRWGGTFTLSWRQLVQFNLANGTISLVGNMLLMRIVGGQLHLSLLAANAISIAACSLVNFVASDTWVFISRGQADSGRPVTD